MPVSWNSEKELKLLIVMIQAANVKPAWGLIATEMNTAYGGGFTADSIRQHYQKNLLKNANAVGSNNTPAVGPSTPAKSSKAKAVVTKASKRKANTAPSDDEDTSVPKKAKQSPKIIVKDEDKDAEGDTDNDFNAPNIPTSA